MPKNKQKVERMKRGKRQHLWYTRNLNSCSKLIDENAPRKSKARSRQGDRERGEEKEREEQLVA